MSEIVVSLIGLAGSVIVAILSYMGNATATKKAAEASRVLIEYRMQQLEEKVDKHNGMIERMYKVEGRLDEAEHDIRDIKGRIA